MKFLQNICVTSWAVNHVRFGLFASEVPVEDLCRSVHQPYCHRKAKNQSFKGNSDTLLRWDSRYCLYYNNLITPSVVTSFGLGNNSANKNIVITVNKLVS